MTPAAVLSILVQAKGIQKTSAELEKLNASAKRNADAADSMNKRFSNLDNTVGDFNRTITASGNAMKLVKFPAMIAGAGMAAQAMGALAAGAASVGAALAPLVGTGAAVAAGYVAIGQAAGVAKLATSGLEDAISGQKGAMDKLSPVQREFVKDIREAKDQAQGLRGAAQRGLLPGLSDALSRVTPMFGRLKPIIGDTAQAMGGMAVEASRVVRTWGSDLTAVGKTNVTVIRTLGHAVIVAADAARHLVVAGGPLLTWLSKMAVVGAEWARSQIKAGRESGRLAGFLEKTRDVMATLGRMGGNLAVAFFNIGKAAAPLGRELLSALEKVTAKFREWTESAAGRNELAAYFRDAKAPIMAMAGLIGDIGGALLRLSRPGRESTDLFQRLRELVPVLENVVATTTAAFGPVFIDALINVVRLFGALAGTSGPLNVFVQIIGLLAGGLADLLSSSPALNTMVVSMVGFAGVIKALGLASAITGMSALGGVIVGTAGAYTALAAGATTAAVAQERGAIATALARAAMVAGAVAASGLAAAQWLLNAALLANPFVLVAVLLAALVAGMVIAYKESTTFRNIVNAAFNAVKAVASAVFPAIVSIITGAWNTIKTVTTTIWAGIRTALSVAWEGIRILASAAWGLIRDAIVNPVRNAYGSISEILGNLKSRAKSVFDDIAGFAASLGDNVKKGVVGAFKGVATTVADFAIAILKVIDKIPGVSMGGAIKGVEDLKVDISKMAKGGKHGGAYARTGGLVNGPITMMGEEAPRHPEFVIPTNPAYRSRAQGLLASAAGAIGFQAGGVWGKGALAKLWERVNPGLGDPNLMAAIALAESGGRQGIVNSIGAGGLWQIHPPEPGYLDPVTNARIAGRKLRTQGLKAWEVFTNGSYKKFLGKGDDKGILGAITGAISGAIDFISDLPGLPDLPDWAAGIPKFILQRAKDWIGEHLPFSGGGGPGGGQRIPATGGLLQLPEMIRVTHQTAGLAGYPAEDIFAAPGTRVGSPVSGAITRLAGQAGGPGGGGAYGYSIYMTGAGKSYFLTHFGKVGVRAGQQVKRGDILGTVADYPGGVPDHIHQGVRGMMKGGVWGGAMPFVGSYAGGGVVPRDGFALVHQGETVMPAGEGALMHVETMNVYEPTDFERELRRLAWAVEMA
jgi:murein DD-endopeptidase MepM/ murein hydrolase activator NlpD